VAKADLKGPASTVVFSLSINDSDVGAKEVANVKNGFASATFHVHNPQLWYPSGYGGQPLYVLTAELLAEEGATSKQGPQDRVTKKLGLRQAEVVQRELRDAPGTSFFVRVNGIPIFCGGSNWIPADNFLPRVSRRRYRQWVRKAVDGNQVMLRFWGGGVYEDDALYEACDELGVLVWQDFQFACGNYPAFPTFLASVRAEATANVKRLRHHACIVVWAGNNEDYQYGESAGLDYDPRDGDPQSWLRGSFPARYIYEKLLVEVTSALVPGAFYHFGSPWGGASTRDATVGDIHQWNGMAPKTFPFITSQW
jgi:beta-mannosidase